MVVQRPRGTFEDVLQAGLKALDMAKANGLALRLAPGKLDELLADITGLGGLVPRAIETSKAAQIATATELQRLAEGYARITAVRTAVQRTAPAGDVRKAWGVGAKCNATSVKHVLAMLDLIVARAGSHAGEMRNAGLLSTDIDALKAAAGAIRDADSDQELQRARAPLTTRERNLAATRIIKAVEAIACAGILQFATDSVRRAEFEALLVMGKPKQPPKKAKSPGTPPPGP